MTDLTTLTGITWDHPRAFASLQGCSAVIETALNVRIEWKVRSLLDFGDRVAHEYASDFDLLILDHPHIPQAVAAGALVNLKDTLDLSILNTLATESAGPSHASYTFAGGQWALAIDSAAQVSAWRPDKISSPPLLWSDALQIGRRGQLLWPYTDVDAFSTFATLMAQQGAALTNHQHFDKTVAEHTLDFLAELASVVPWWCADANPIAVCEALADADGYAAAVALFGYSNYSRPEFRRHRVIFDDIPSFDGRSYGSMLGGAGIAVSAHTSHRVLASQVASMLCAADLQQGSYGLSGGQPGNIRALRDPDLNELVLQSFVRTLRTVENAWVRPQRTTWPAEQLGMSQVIRDHLRGGITAAKSAELISHELTFGGEEGDRSHAVE